MKIVEFEGPRNPKLYLVGEAPSASEEIEGRPFVGASGRLLNRLLTDQGILRAECRVGNVMRIRPPGNQFSHFYLDKKCTQPKQELIEGRTYLVNDILASRPNLVVALGNEPLKALVGESGITNWRGSILWSDRADVKVIPTFHPSSLFRAWGNAPLVMLDFQRIRDEMLTPKYTVPTYNFLYTPTIEQIEQHLRMFVDGRMMVTFDVETDEDLHITVLSLAWSPHDAISIPFTIDGGIPYWTLDEEDKIWEMLKWFFEKEEVPKIAQNAQFDMITFLIGYRRIKVKGLFLDTMVGFHTVYPEIASSEKEATTGTPKHKIGGGKKLALLCSIYTRQPYYKHWAHSGNDKQFWKYNCMDSAVTHLCAQSIKREMEEFGVYDYYQKMVHPLIPILLKMQIRGVLVDEKVRLEAKYEYEQRLGLMTSRLQEAVGYPFNVASPKQLKFLLYDDLGLPPVLAKHQKKVDEEKSGEPSELKTTTNEDALLELKKKTGSPIFDYILKIRQDKKILGTYLEGNVANDGRMHCSYNLGKTENGRLSSSASVLGTGTNLQNIPHGPCRRMLIADPGKVMIAGDLSQAEARVVAYLAEERTMIEVFESGKDIHQSTADTFPPSFIPKGTAYEEVPNPRRLFAKKHVHAFNYGESEYTFARRADIPLQLAREIRNNYFFRFPGILSWHTSIQASLRRSRTLTAPLGRKRTFFAMWNDALFREAYAFAPQATVADANNLATIRMGELDLLLTTHDENVIQCDEDKVEEHIKLMQKAYDIPIPINGRILRIPVEIKVGKNWEELKKWNGKENKNVTTY